MSMSVHVNLMVHSIDDLIMVFQIKQPFNFAFI